MAQYALIDFVWSRTQPNEIDTPEADMPSDAALPSSDPLPIPLHVFLAYTAVFHWNNDVFLLLVDPQSGLDISQFMRYASTEAFCEAVFENLQQQWGPAKKIIAIMDWLFSRSWNFNKADPTGMGGSFYEYLGRFHKPDLLRHYRRY
ncbi:hypothetical protein H9P43_005076 [Blastocladiella emersonii ATCC 22665]|nr:hypothetical protein H9P43_005076 [Blastocladiella emersonii ATCC 22665]